MTPRPSSPRSGCPRAATPTRAVRAVDEEIDRVATDGVSADELRRVVARTSAELHQLADNVMERTLAAASYEQQRGRAELVWEVPEMLRAVTPEQVTAAAATLTPTTRARLDVVPGSRVVSPAARAAAPREVPALARAPPAPAAPGLRAACCPTACGWSPYDVRPCRWCTSGCASRPRPGVPATSAAPSCSRSRCCSAPTGAPRRSWPTPCRRWAAGSVRAATPTGSRSRASPWHPSSAACSTSSARC